MSRSYFIYNGIDSRDYNLIVSTTDDFSTSLRSYDVISVPGRNGDVYKDNLKYENVSVTYHCQIDSQKWLGFGDAFEAFRRALNACTGYCELLDSYRPEIVRQAVLATVVKPASTGPAWNIGEFDITFSCKPQIWMPSEFINDDIIPVIHSSSTNTTDYIALTPNDIITLSYNSNSAKTPVAGYLTVNFYDAGKTLVLGAKVARNRVSTVKSKDECYFFTLSWIDSCIPDGANLTVFVAGEKRGKLCTAGNIIENISTYDIYPTITLARTSATMDAEKKITLNGYTITVQPFSGTIVIDCENMTITDGNGNSMDKYVGIADSTGEMAYDFPCIPAESSVEFIMNDIADATANVLFNISIEGTAVTV